MTSPTELEPPNAPKDPFTVSKLARSMEADGWQGYPLVVHEGRALNGSHRLAAAQKAGLSNVPTMSVQEVARIIGVDLDDYQEDGHLAANRLMRDWYRFRDTPREDAHA